MHAQDAGFVSKHFSGVPKEWFPQRVVLAHVPWTPTTGTRVVKTERRTPKFGPKTGTRTQKNGTTVQKARARAHSPKPFGDSFRVESLKGIKRGKSTLVGALVWASVGALVGGLVDPLVAQISPALCVAHGMGF